MKIAVCVPCHDQVMAFWAYDFARLVGWSMVNIEDLKLLQYFTLGTYLPTSREKLIDAALRHEDLDYVLFIDSDMRFPKDALARLLAHDVDVAGINYCQRQEPFWPVARTKLTDALEDRVLPIEGEDLTQVAMTGFGMLLIKAEYLRKMEKPRFAMPWSKASSTFVGEDTYFCMRLNEVGAKLYVDNNLSRECRHTGSFEFGLDHAVQYIYNEAEKAKAE